jgi:uncharacterized membrane protein
MKEITSSKSVKLFGIIGYILILFGGIFLKILLRLIDKKIPVAIEEGIVWFLTFFGLILSLLAFKKLSEIFSKNEIFKDYLTYLLIFLVVILLEKILSILAFERTVFLSESEKILIKQAGPIGGLFVGIKKIGPWFLAINLITYFPFLFGAYFLRRCFKNVSQETRVDIFKSAGELYFWGALLKIILIGLPLCSIGELLTLYGFFALPKSFSSQKLNTSF